MSNSSITLQIVGVSKRTSLASVFESAFISAFRNSQAKETILTHSPKAIRRTRRVKEGNCQRLASLVISGRPDSLRAPLREVAASMLNRPVASNVRKLRPLFLERLEAREL